MNISVVMTAYNAENTIAEAIESVLKQSFADFEFIIVNDGSTDNTRSIIESHHDKRIRLIDNSHDTIQSLNTGMKTATGKYIARHNADEIMHIDRLKLQYAVMEEYPEIMVCSSWEIFFGEKMPKRISEQKVAGLIELPLVQLLIDNITINSAYTMRRSFIEENHLFYENCNQAEDYKFWAEAAKLNGNFYIDSQPLVYKRVDETKISRKRRLEKLESQLQIKKEIIPFLCKKYHETYPALSALYDSYKEMLNQKLISENDLFILFHSLFMKNKETFKNLDSNQKQAI